MAKLSRRPISDLKNTKDEVLVKQLIEQGSSRYFEVLYHRYFNKVYYQVLAYVKDGEIAQDVTQEIFIKLHDRISKFSGKSSFSTWLFAFARNMSLDYLRREGKMPKTIADEKKLAELPEVTDNELLKIRSDRLNRVLDKLDPDEKAILIMMYAHEWQMDEIAAHMGVTLSAVKMRIKRAKAKVVSIHRELFENL